MRHPRRRVLLAALAGAGLASAAAGWGAEPASGGVSQREIAGLIEALGESGCEFQRNGRWYSAGEARDHLRRKFDWARRRGMHGTAEAFIDRAATRSSLSGRPYRVRCGAGGDAPAADWLRSALGRLRAADSSQPPR